MSGEDDASREHEPTQKRKDDAREKGEAARSHDLAAAAGALAFALVCLSLGPGALQRVGGILMTPLAEADRMAPLRGAGASAPFAAMGLDLAGVILPFMLLPAFAALAAYGGQRALFATPSNLMPKRARISPMAAIKNRFGMRGLLEFAKNVGKLTVASVVLGVYALANADRILMSLHLSPALATAEMLTLSLGYLAIMALVSGLFGGFDYLIQRAHHLKGLRMTRQEVLEEHKSSEGDPHIKAQRRQRAEAIATNRMLYDVPKADVVIVNPTHFAVALRWDRASGRPPVCVAKGVDEVAARIRARAAEAGVPIYGDPPTARALHAALGVGEPIRPEHYAAVAAAIRFAEALRRRAKAWR